MKKIGVYPGSFDPITNGHVDVIERAAALFDEVMVVIALNAKKSPLFTEKERFEMAELSLKHLDNVFVDTFSGLIIEYAANKNAAALIRGVRAVSDFDYEFQLALMNRKLFPEIATVFLMPHEKYTYLNSSIVRELARLKQDVSDFVPKIVAEMLQKKT